MEPGPRLPNEILLQVIDILSSENSESSRAVLASCRLVSRPLRSFADPLLFRDVCLRRGLRSSIDAMEGLITTNLCGHLRRLTISASACILEKFLKKHPASGEYIIDSGVSKVLQSLEQFTYEARLWADEFSLVYSRLLDNCVGGLEKIILRTERFHGLPCLDFFLNSVGGGFGHLGGGFELETKLAVLEDMKLLSNPTSLGKIRSLIVDCSGSTHGFTDPSLEPFSQAILSKTDCLGSLDITLRNVINQEPFKPSASCIEHLTTLNLTGLLLASDSLTTIYSSTPLLRSSHLCKVQIKESAETWEDVFGFMIDLQHLEDIHFVSLSYVDFWFRVELRRITERNVPRPLESSRSDDYDALAILRDTVARRRDENGLKKDWFLEEVCLHPMAMTVSEEIEDDELMERLASLVYWIETGNEGYWDEIRDLF